MTSENHCFEAAELGPRPNLRRSCHAPGPAQQFDINSHKHSQHTSHATHIPTFPSSAFLDGPPWTAPSGVLGGASAIILQFTAHQRVWMVADKCREFKILLQQSMWDAAHAPTCVTKCKAPRLGVGLSHADFVSRGLLVSESLDESP